MDFPESMASEDFFLRQVTFEKFLYAKESWHLIRRYYKECASEVPFLDYFWTVKNMHRPMWIIADIVRNLPEISIMHAPSTGYAGFLGSLASLQKDVPLILTEHGIYTRERKIDLLTADWLEYHQIALMGSHEEDDYIRDLWVRFFMRLAIMAYRRAGRIFALYEGARNVQVAFGAPEEKTAVIPNGVDVDGLGELVEERPAGVPHVVTLIGRVVSIKDIKTFIRAMRITVDTIGDAEGWIVGPDDEDPEYAAECRRMVEALKMEEHVKFLGFRNIRDILPKTGLLTLTSISEGMPLVILEGFAAGVPAVATDVGSCRDLIEGGIDDTDRAFGSAGAVTRIANPSELAERYIEFLRDEDRWKKAQSVALKRVGTYYRQESFLERYDRVYDRMTAVE